MQAQANTSAIDARRQAYLKWCDHVAASLAPQRTVVLRLAAKGLTNRVIASRLKLSPLTVKSHLRLASGVLRPYTERAGVVTLSRTGMAVIITRAQLFPEVDDLKPGLDEARWSATIESRLTPHDQQIVSLVARGMPNAEIAQKLGRGESAIKDSLKVIAECLSSPAGLIGVEQMSRTGIAVTCVRARLF